VSVASVCWRDGRNCVHTPKVVSSNLFPVTTLRGTFAGIYDRSPVQARRVALCIDICVAVFTEHRLSNHSLLQLESI